MSNEPDFQRELGALYPGRTAWLTQPIIDFENVIRRVERLTDLGVEVPPDYPPANLPAGSAWLSSVLSVVDAVSLLVRVFPPGSIRIEPRYVAGDTDIRVSADRTYHLQVKTWLPVSVRSESLALPLEDLLWGARTQILGSFTKGSPLCSSFTLITIHWDDKGNPVYSGMTNTVQNSSGVHVIVTQVDPEVLNEMARRKFVHSLEKAKEQLEPAGIGVKVPVIDLTKYPHDQPKLVRYAKQLFSEGQLGTDIGGVLLVTNKPGREEPITGLIYPEPRFIGIENPSASPVARLEPSLFNPSLNDENLYEESHVVLRADPPSVPIHLSGRSIIVGELFFGLLPKGTSLPYAIKPIL